MDKSSLPVLCDRCGGEIFPDEPAHVIDGFIICGECFEEFAYEYFRDCLMTGGDIKEMLLENADD